MAAKGLHVICLISLIVFVSLSLADDGSDAVSYDKNAFQLAIGSKKHFVMFFAPWCGHCKQLAPTWNELAKVYNHEKSPITVAKVDCTVETALCSEHDVARYPTLKFFYKKADDFQRYKGNGNLDSLKQFVEDEASRVDCTLSPKQCIDQGVKDYPTLILFKNDDKVDQYNQGNPWSLEDLKHFVNKNFREEGICYAGGPLVELTDETFKNVIQEGFHFIQFYAPWCGHCKQLAPTWEKLARSFAGGKHVSISKVDCTLSTKLCTDQGVEGYPTLILFKNGDKVEQYQGSHSYEDLKNFVNKNFREEDAVVDLTDEAFKEATAAGRTFVNFFAPWSGHCKHLAPTWTKLGQANEGKDVTIARVDCTKYQALCHTESVEGYPTLLMYHDGQRKEFQGQKDQDSLQDFVDSFQKHTEL